MVYLLIYSVLTYTTRSFWLVNFISSRRKRKEEGRKEESKTDRKGEWNKEGMKGERKEEGGRKGRKDGEENTINCGSVLCCSSYMTISGHKFKMRCSKVSLVSSLSFLLVWLYYSFEKVKFVCDGSLFFFPCLYFIMSNNNIIFKS